MNLADKIISTAKSLSSTPRALFGSWRSLQRGISDVDADRSFLLRIGLASSKSVVTQIGRRLTRMELKEHQKRWPVIGQSDVTDVCRKICESIVGLERAFEAGELSSRLTSGCLEHVLGPLLYETYGKLASVCTISPSQAISARFASGSKTDGRASGETCRTSPAISVTTSSATGP
jgi:hypothetical protein